MPATPDLTPPHVSPTAWALALALVVGLLLFEALKAMLSRAHARQAGLAGTRTAS